MKVERFCKARHFCCLDGIQPRVFEIKIITIPFNSIEPLERSIGFQQPVAGVFHYPVQLRCQLGGVLTSNIKHVRVKNAFLK